MHKLKDVVGRKVIPIKNLRGQARASAEPAPIDHRAVGDGYRDGRQWLDAAAAYGKYLDAVPEDFAIWIQAGNCFKEGGNFARSLAAYRKAQQLQPDSFEVHLQLGHLHKVCGHYAAALASYERAAALDPEFGEIKHEIVDLAERIRSTAGKSSLLPLFASVEELIDALRKLPDHEDPFAAYFRSVGGYAIGRPL